jgi:GPH family glycoside/pentoside/hexuronide:cation symporter
MTQPATLPRSDMARYSALALPLAFAGMPLYVHAPDYYATQLNVSLAQIGIALLALRLFDAVQDPLIGRISDRFAARRGAFMLACAALLVVAFAALFQPQASPMIWFIITMLLATSAYSVLSINLNTLGGLWSADAHQKTRITTWRESFGLIGLLVAVMLPSVLQQKMEAKDAFMWVSTLLALLMVVSAGIFMRWHKRHPIACAPTQSTPFWHVMRHLPRSTKRFFGIYGLSMLASSMPALLILFFVRDRLDAEALTGLFLALYFMAAAPGMPLWQFLSRRFGKAPAWALAMGFAVISFIWAGFLGAGDAWQFAIICTISGIAFGADLALPPSMLADQIQAHEQASSASLQFSLLTFLIKASLALASAIAFALLDAAGFNAGEANTPNALLMLSAVYAIIPCIIKVIAAVWLWRSFALVKQGDNHHETSIHLNGSHTHAQ